MARPLKQGLSYFPLDVGFMDDIKIRKIIRACGIQSVAVLISLLGNIYEDNGYYLVWDSDMPFLIADKIGVSEGAVHEIVKKAMQAEFFNSDIFEKYQILTSRGIQSRYIEAIGRRKEVTLLKEYMLIDVHEKNINVNINWINVDNNGVNVDNNGVNVCNNEQNKIKKNKKKENNINNICSPAANESDVIDLNITPFDYVFEQIWALYPKKRGKNQVSDTKKREIAKIGFEKMKLALERYLEEMKGKDMEYMLNGSTFFHGRYKDYLDDNYSPIKAGQTDKRLVGIERWLNESNNQN